MFELNYPAFVNVLSSIEKLEEELKEVFVSHQGSVTNLEQNWYGATSVFERNHMMEALSTGSYYRAGKYTTGIKKIMEDYQLLIQQLMARREQLGNYCLEQKDTEMMNAIVQALFIVDDTTYCTDMGIFPDIYTDYMEAEVDVEKIQLLLANMDPVTNLQAYQSLYNLTNIEPMRIKTDDPITSPGGWISVSADGLDEKVPYLTIFFNVRTGKTGFGAFEDKEVKVYVYDLADSYSEDVQKTMDDIDLSGEELESILGEYGLNKSYDEYESMSDEEKANYDALAWLATMAMLPDEIPVPGTYTLPVGLDMTITYTVSVKGTLSDGDVSTTVEMQKKELKSLTLSKDNADLIITDDEISVNVKSEIEGLNEKVGSGVELGSSGGALGVFLDEGETITEIKMKYNTDNSTSIIYSVETKVSQNSSIYSELEIKKENNNDNLPGWKPVGIPMQDIIPEPIRDLLENPVFGPMPVPVPVF